MTSAYNDLINVASFWKKRENFAQERWVLSHYCHDCKKIVEVEMINVDHAKYRCGVCGGEKIASGSAAALHEHFSKKH